MIENPAIPRNKIRSLAVYRKALSEHQNDIFLNKDWHSSLSATMATYKTAITSRILSGYIQNIEKDGQLQITIFLEKQLDCIHKTPFKSRVCHIDATGSQVKIKKAQQQHEDLCSFKRILNYYILINNSTLDEIDAQSAFQLAELVSSSHDVTTLSVFFLRLKLEYEKVHKNDHNLFRFIISDFSWAIMHSAWIIFIGLTAIQYSDRVFLYATGTFTIYKISIVIFKLISKFLKQKGELIDEDFTWILSCIAHTMKRFAQPIKILGIVDFLHSYACFCFSLLANCTSIELAGQYYKSICNIFLSPTSNDSVTQSKTLIKTAVSERPDDLNELMKMLEPYKLQVLTLNVDFVADTDDDVDLSDTVDESDDACDNDDANDHAQEVIEKEEYVIIFRL